MNKTLLIVIILVVVALLAWYGYSRWSGGGYRAPAPTGTTGTAPYPAEAPDTTASITSGLQDIDLGDIDQDFKAIDAELQGL